MAKINKQWCDQWRDQYGTTTRQNKNKIKFRKWELWTYNFRKRRKTNMDLPQVRSVKRTCGRGTAAGKRPEDVGRRTASLFNKEDLREWNGSSRKAARSVPLQLHNLRCLLFLIDIQVHQQLLRRCWETVWVECCQLWSNLWGISPLALVGQCQSLSHEEVCQQWAKRGMYVFIFTLMIYLHFSSGVYWIHLKQTQ